MADRQAIGHPPSHSTRQPSGRGPLLKTPWGFGTAASLLFTSKGRLQKSNVSPERCALFACLPVPHGAPAPKGSHFAKPRPATITAACAAAFVRARARAPECFAIPRARVFFVMPVLGYALPAGRQIPRQLREAAARICRATYQADLHLVRESAG